MEFKVGDRVAVYSNIREVGTIESVQYKCVSRDGTEYPMVGVRVRGGTTYAHPKQCRRLKEDGRRRLWLRPSGGSGSLWIQCYPTESGAKEFIEVRR
jgi:hypothetical protein